MIDTKDMSVDTLFYAFSKGLLPRPAPGHRTLFLNARFHEGLAAFQGHHLYVQQFFKPYVTGLQDNGFTALADFPEAANDFDVALVLLPKNQIEAEYTIAQALCALKPAGLLVVSADNKAGGGRLEKTLYKFGLDNFSTAVKHKARVLWANVDKVDAGAVQKALGKGAEQSVLGGRFISQPGVFGWDKIDLGSQILLQHLPSDLKGVGADFGCGYGYLSCGLAQRTSITGLTCMDADARAVALTQKNMAMAQPVFPFECLWEDLCSVNSARKPLDFIIMNPPFHEGRLSDSALGIKFIQTAARSLKPGGALWMVANSHLPYEEALSKNFQNVHKVFEGDGFKILQAVR
jgi:16S rRNA (guanine1207-N2)-methyltransferase